MLKILAQLKIFWMIAIALALGVLLICLWAKWPLLSAAAGVIGALATNSLFSCPNQVLFRGTGDGVYFIDNRLSLLWLPSIHSMSQKTIFAFGGRSEEIVHISNKALKYTLAVFRKGEPLVIETAEFVRETNQKSVFAVLLNTLYGIPDKTTLEKLTPNPPQEKSKNELDRYKSGHDIVSAKQWPSDE